MIKKTLATVAVAASVVGAAGVAASPALAVGGNAEGPTSVNGNGAAQAYGNTTTAGYMSPNISLVNGSLNKPCVALPPDLTAQSLVGVIPVGLDDLLASKPNQACAENSTLSDGHDPLSGLLSDLSLLSENGESVN